jgi:hypothetical protein
MDTTKKINMQTLLVFVLDVAGGSVLDMPPRKEKALMDDKPQLPTKRLELSLYRKSPPTKSLNDRGEQIVGMMLENSKTHPLLNVLIFNGSHIEGSKWADKAMAAMAFRQTAKDHGDEVLANLDITRISRIIGTAFRRYDFTPLMAIEHQEEPQQEELGGV